MRVEAFFAACALLAMSSCASLEVPDTPPHETAVRQQSPRPEAILRLLAAKRAERRGDSAGALAQWQAAVRADSSSPSLRLGLAKAYSVQRNDSLALLNGRRSVLLDSNYVDGHLFLAGLYEGRNDFASAATHLEAAFRESKSPETGWQLARLYARLAKPEESRRVYQTMADSPTAHPDDVLAWAEQVQMSPVKGASDIFYTTCMRRWPGNEEGVGAYAEYLARSGRRVEAERLLREWSASHPDSREVPKRYIQLLVAQDRWADADSVWMRIRRESPDDLVEQKGWITYLTKRGQIPLAIANAQRLIETHPSDGDGYVLLGQAHAAQGDLHAAAAAFEQAASQDSSLEALSELAYAQAGLKQYAAAERAARQGLSKYPRDERLLSLYSAALSSQNKWREAVPVLRALAERDTTDTDRLFDLGAGLERAGEFDSAVVVFKRLLAINRHHADALNYLGFMFADRNVHLAEAESLLTEAVRLEPRNAAFLDSMGWLFFRQGRYQEAKQHLADAIEIDDSVAEMHVHLGDVLSALGDRDNAREAYRAALRLDPANRTVERKLRLLERR